MDTLLKNLKKQSLVAYLCLCLLLVYPLLLVFLGEPLRGLGAFAFVSSIILGPLIGIIIAKRVNILLFWDSKQLGERFVTAMGGFGFGFFPALIGTWTNAHLGTLIGLGSISLHFVVACIAAIFLFCLTPTNAKR